jgi:hypothetical protein
MLRWAKGPYSSSVSGKEHHDEINVEITRVGGCY